MRQDADGHDSELPVEESQVRCRWQYSLRSLLVVFTVLIVIGGWFSSVVARYRLRDQVRASVAIVRAELDKIQASPPLDRDVTAWKEAVGLSETAFLNNALYDDTSPEQVQEVVQGILHKDDPEATLMVIWHFVESRGTEGAAYAKKWKPEFLQFIEMSRIRGGNARGVKVETG